MRDTTSSSGGSCFDRYLNYIHIDELWAYTHNSLDSALRDGFGLGYTTHSKQRATSGPCVLYSGKHEHWNVRSGSFQIGVITSCECCDDSSGGAKLRTVYRAQ